MKILAGLALALLSVAWVPAASARDASIHEVYQAVHDGRLGEAQSMMMQVLRDHPESAQAHYVEAEVLVRLDRAEEARGELARAQSLAPGLPFLKDHNAARELQDLIAEHSRPHALGLEQQRAPAQVVVQQRPQSSGGGFPWGLLFVFGAIGIVVFLFMRNRYYPATTVVMGPGGGPVPYGGGPVPYGGGPMPYGGAPYGGGYGMPMGGGIGSGIVGGLATGAALGAGIVAGEALAHEFTGHHDSGNQGGYVPGGSGAGASSVSYSDPAPERDFGIADSGSWDSGGGDMGGGGDSGGGGGDWG